LGGGGEADIDLDEKGFVKFDGTFWILGDIDPDLFVKGFGRFSFTSLDLPE